MSRDSPEAADAEPRRGGRARKVVERFAPGKGEGGRKKRKQRDDEDASEEEVDGEEGEDEEGQSSEEEVSTPIRRKKVTNGAGTKTKSKANGAARKGKNKAVVRTEGEAGEADTGLPKDSALFNALLSPNIALEPLVEEWVETYQQTANDDTSERISVQELIQFIIRCCGLKAEIEEGEAADVDGVIDVVERIQDEVVNTNLAAYPLVSRTKEFRAFRNNLNKFISHLIKTLSLTPLIYETDKTTSHLVPIISLLQAWILSMQSSTLRPIRHTATYFELKICSALCDVAADVKKEVSVKQRQKEAEARKGGKNVKEAEKKVAEALTRQKRLEEYLFGGFDTMFTHRVRDADPNIRVDCMKELGVWIKRYPDMYLTSARFNYMQRGVNDPHSPVRLETLRGLVGLYSRESLADQAKSGIIRLISRLIQIALQDVDISVRTTALEVLTLIDKTGVIEDENAQSRLKIAKLIFDAEPRVRKGVSGFVKGLWEEKVRNLKSTWDGVSSKKAKRAEKAKISEKEMTTMLGWKAFAGILCEVGETLVSTGEVDESVGGEGRQKGTTGAMGRAGAAVEALWKDFGDLQEWEGLGEYLLLDHSTEKQDMWLLGQGEEDFLIMVFIACIKQDQNEDDTDNGTKSLIKTLPRLITKHQAEPARLAGILSIPEYMKLSVYQDMRATKAYESLWDDISKQFLQHTSPLVLTPAIKAINHLSQNTSLATANASKLADLQESLFTSLRDVLGEDEDIFGMSMEEDRLSAIQAGLLRLVLLCRMRDCVDMMEGQDAGVKGWDVVCAFAERGDVGYKEEAKMVEYAVQCVFLHLAWSSKRLEASSSEDQENGNEGGAADEQELDAFVSKRNKAVEILYKLGVNARSHAVDAVKRQAVISYLNLHILLNPKSTKPSPAATFSPLTISDETQNTIGGALSEMIERHASDMADLAPERIDEMQLPFLQLISVYVGAIRCGVLEITHAVHPLVPYGRFGGTYDAVVKRLMDVLKDEGIFNNDAETVRAVSVAALTGSFDIFLDSEEAEPTATISLAKLLATSYIIYGTHFTVARQIDHDEIAQLHLKIMDYATRQVKQSNLKHKAHRTRVSTIFRAMLLLVGPLSGEGALRLMNYGDDAGFSGEAWKTYERKLMGIAAKDSKTKGRAGEGGGKRKRVDDELEVREDDRISRRSSTSLSPEPEPVKTPTKRRVVRQRSETLTPALDDEDEAEGEGEVPAVEDGGDVEVEGQGLEEMEVDLQFEDEMNEDGGIVDEWDLGLPTSQQQRERSPSVERQMVGRRKKAGRK